MTALRSEDEQGRLAVLTSLQLVSGGRDERFDRVTRVAAALFDVPVAFVSVVDADRLWFKSCVGLPGDSLPRAESFCAHTVAAARLLIVPDLRLDERFAESAYVTQDGFRFYAGHPLVVSGHVVGTVCLLDRRPRDLSEDEQRLLADLGAWAERELLAADASADDDGSVMLQLLERRNDLVLQSVETAIYGVDRAGVVTFANPAAAALLAEDLRDMVGRDFHETYHHTRADGSRYAWQDCPTHDVLELGVARRVPVDVVHRRDGTPVEVEYAASPIEVGGEIEGAVVTLVDISQRRAVERLKDEFVSVVSHELRTPLTSIRGSLGLLGSGRFGELPPQGARLVEIALSNTERLVRLVNDILDLERIEAGKTEVHPRLQPLGPVLEAARDAVAGTAQSSGVEIVTSGGDVLALVDADTMVRAVTNLIGNAVKFSPEGGVVDVSAAREGEHVLISVRDTGRGIPADRLERVFQRFEQVDASDAREKGGTGLGLAITRSIVERHGGTVRVASEVGVGSTFTIELPAPTPRAGHGGTRADVVLIEDDDDLVELLSTALEGAGLTVASARGVDEGVHLVTSLRPGLVVLDVELEDGEGFAVVEALRRDPAVARTPLVVASVHDLPPADRRRLTLGPTSVLAKGTSGADIVGAVVAAAREHVPVEGRTP